jgi:hypothetical protein
MALVFLIYVEGFFQAPIQGDFSVTVHLFNQNQILPKHTFCFLLHFIAPVYTHAYSLPALEGYHTKHQSLKDWLNAEAGSLFMQLSCHNNNCTPHQIEFKHQLATFVKAF